MALKIIAAGIVLWGALAGSLFAAGIATIDNYNGTYGVSIGSNTAYCSFDATAQGNFVTSFSCQNGQ
jgi:hypothetical protein